MTEDEARARIESLFGESNLTSKSMYDEDVPVSAAERPGTLRQFANGIVQGTSKTVGELFEVLPELAYSLTGNKEAADQKRKEWEDRLKNLDKKYPVTSLGEVGAHPLDAVASLLGESIPTLASILIPGSLAAKGATKLAPTLLGKVVPATAETAAQIVPKASTLAAGLGAAGAAEGIPSSFASIESATGQRAPGMAAIAGTLEGALNAIPGFILLDRLGKNSLIDSLTKRILTEGAFQGAIGAGVGGAGAAIQEVATNFVDSNKGDINNVIQGMLGGAIQGGVLGGIIGATHKAPEIVPPKPPEQIAGLLEAPGIASRRQADRTQYDTSYGRLNGAQVDDFLASNNHLPGMEDVLTAKDVDEHQRRQAGLSLIDRLSQPAIEAAANQPRTIQDLPARLEETPAEPQYPIGHEVRQPYPGGTHEPNAPLSPPAEYPPGYAAANLPKTGTLRHGPPGETLPFQHETPPPDRTIADWVNNPPHDLNSLHARLTSAEEGGFALKPGDLVTPDDIRKASNLKGADARAVLEEMKQKNLLDVKDGKAYIKTEPPVIPEGVQRTKNLLEAARNTLLGEPKELITPEVLDKVHEDLLRQQGKRITKQFVEKLFPQYDANKLYSTLIQEAYLSKNKNVLTKGQRDNTLLLREAEDLKKNSRPQASQSNPWNAVDEHPIVQLRAKQVRDLTDAVNDYKIASENGLSSEWAARTKQKLNSLFSNKREAPQLQPNKLLSTDPKVIHQNIKDALEATKKLHEEERSAVRSNIANTQASQPTSLYERPKGDIDQLKTVHGEDEYERNNWATSHIHDYLEKFAPTANLRLFNKLVAEFDNGEQRNWHGASFGDTMIALAIEHTDGSSYLGTLDHEIVHFLQKANLITDEEYNSLKHQAIKEGWIERNFIDVRYPDLKDNPNKLLDEAIAEQYRRWHNGELEDHRGIFQKIKDWFTGLFKSLSPQELIFAKIASGEVGQRVSAQPYMRTMIHAAQNDIKWKDSKNLGSLDQMWHTVRGLADKYPTLRTWADGLEIKRQQRTLMRSKYSQRFADILKSAEDKTNLMRYMEAAEYIKEPVLGANVVSHEDGRGKLFLSRPGDRITLSPKDYEVSKLIRQGMIDMRNDLVKSILVRLDHNPDMTPAQLRATGVEKDANTARLIETLYNSPNYFPHMRFGDVAVTVKKGDRVVHMQTFELPGRQGTLIRSLAKRKAQNTIRQEREKLIKQYPGHKVSDPFNMTYENFKSLIGNPVADLRTAFDMFASGDEALSQRMLDDIEKHLLARNMKLNFLERKNIPGWINDTNAKNYVDRALNAYVMRGSTFFGNNMAYKRIQQGIKEINDTNNPTYRQYVNNVMDQINSGTEDFQTVRNISFMYYLGFNASSAAMNAMQTMHTTWPMLTAIAGTSGTKSLGSGYKLALKMIADHRQILTGGNPLEILNKDLSKYFGGDKAKAEAFKEALQDGILAPMQAFEFAGNEHGDFATLLGAKGSLAKYAQLSASLFSTAEIFNRISTWSAFHDAFQNPKALASMDKMMSQQGTWQALKETGLTPASAAKYMTNKTQFVMDASNKAMIQRGATMSLVTQFMSYNLQMLELWNQMLGKRSGIEGKKVAGLMAMSMIMTSGVWSLPGFGNIKDGVEYLYKLLTDQGIDIDRITKESLDEIALYPQFATNMTRGFLPSVMGGSLASRAGAGRIVNTQALGGSFDNMLGPSWSMTVGSAQAALDQWRNGHEILALGEVLPIAAQSVAKAFDAQQHGFRSATGKQYIAPQDVEYNQLLNQALGFRPEKAARMSDYFQAQKDYGNRLDSITKHFHQGIAQAQEQLITAKTQEDRNSARRDMNELMTQVNEYNKGKPPQDMIKINRSSIAELVKQALTSRGNIKGVPARMRPEVLAMKPLYGV